MAPKKRSGSRPAGTARPSSQSGRHRAGVRYRAGEWARAVGKGFLRGAVVSAREEPCQGREVTREGGQALALWRWQRVRHSALHVVGGAVPPPREEERRLSADAVEKMRAKLEAEHARKLALLAAKHAAELDSVKAELRSSKDEITDLQLKLKRTTQNFEQQPHWLAHRENAPFERSREAWTSASKGPSDHRSPTRQWPLQRPWSPVPKLPLSCCVREGGTPDVGCSWDAVRHSNHWRFRYEGEVHALRAELRDLKAEHRRELQEVKRRRAA